MSKYPTMNSVTAIGASRSVESLQRVRATMTLQIALIALAFLYVQWAAAITDVWPRIMALGWACNILVVMQIWNLRRAFGTTLAPAVMYALLLALFTIGQVSLFTFGVVPGDADVLKREAPESIAEALTFFLPAYAFFGCGLLASRLLILRREHAQSDGRGVRQSEPTREDWQSGLQFAGVLCISIGVLPFLWSNLRNLSIVWSSGYSRYYEEGARLNSPLVGLGYLFVTGLILVGCSGNMRTRRAAIAALVGVGALRLLSGDRGEGLIYLISALMLSTSTTPHVGARRRVAPVALGLFAIMVIPVIGVLRHTWASGEGTVGEALAEESPLTGTLTTLGATLHPLVKTMELVPDAESHLMGASYVASLALVLPGVLRIGSLEPLASTPLTGSPATWLMQTIGMSYGPGFTPFAEGYLNFGSIGGYLALFVLGLFMGTLLHTPSWRLPSGPVRVAVALAAFALIGFSVRGSFNFVPSFTIRYVLLPLLLTNISAHTYRRRRLRK